MYETKSGKKVSIVIPSKERAEAGTTWNLFPDATVFVHERELEEYKKHLPNAKIETHTEDGGLTPIRNIIMRKISMGDWVIQLDDDIKVVGYFTADGDKKKKVKWSSKQHMNEWFNAIDLAEKSGFYLIGESPTANEFYYRPERPHSINTFVEGHCMIIKRCELMFDEKCRVKQDYDYTLQCAVSGRRVLRLDYLWSDYTYRKAAGGCMDTWKKSGLEEEVYNYMMNKWKGLLIPKRNRASSPYEFTMRVPKEWSNQ